MKKYLLLAAAFAAPTFAFAQGIENLIITVKNILDLVIPIIITLAVIYFFWGLAKYILNTGDQEKREEARNIMIYGIIILFVMVAIWGLVGIIANTIGVSTGGTIELPRVPNQ